MPGVSLGVLMKYLNILLSFVFLLYMSSVLLLLFVCCFCYWTFGCWFSMLYTRVVLTDKNSLQFIALVCMYIKLFQLFLADIPNHHQVMHTSVTLSSEYIVTLPKVRVECTFQNILQYIHAQLSVMYRINNVKCLQLNKIYQFYFC